MNECQRRYAAYSLVASRGVPNTIGAIPAADKADCRRDPHFEVCSQALEGEEADFLTCFFRIRASFSPV